MLKKSASKEALKQNIGTEIAAGKRPDVAAAIAYDVQRKAKSGLLHSSKQKDKK